MPLRNGRQNHYSRKAKPVTDGTTVWDSISDYAKDQGMTRQAAWSRVRAGLQVWEPDPTDPVWEDGPP